MQIEKLIVKETFPTERIIREIIFKKNQLNLIVDVTKNVPQESGNSVGKTTAVKIIDLCLGASSVTSLYRDNDTRSDNIKVKNYLKDKKVSADLILCGRGKRIKITRDLFPNGSRYIDDKKYNKKDFELKLKEILFNSNTPKPTVRQLLNRFIRLGNTQLENVIQYLDGYNTKEDYESIHLFLLNAVDQSVISDKMEYEEKIREYKKDLDKFMRNNNITSLEALKQNLDIINKELITKLDQRKRINYIEDYKEDLERMQEVTNQLDSIFTEIESVKFDISMMNKSIDMIKNDKFNVSIKDLKLLYREVSEKISSINKQFEDLVKFHNNMINNRISFIQNQLSIKKHYLNKLLSKQEELLTIKQKLSKNLVNENLLADLNALNQKIDELNVRKGEISNLISIYKNYSDRLDECKKKLKEIELESDYIIKAKLNKFNEYFSKYSKILYNESYFLVYNKDWRSEPQGSKGNYPFTMENIFGNVGTGKKRGLIIAFDLAYLEYIAEEGIYAPQFIIHDKLENTHINQLSTIFEICTKINGQYIVPILKERISKVDEKIIKQATILELSQDDKFFRI